MAAFSWKNWISLLFVTVYLGQVSGQSLITLTGKVLDAELREPLAYANVLLEGTTIGASTDLDGRYSLQLLPGSYIIKVSYLGYLTAFEELEVTEAGGKQVLNFELQYGDVVETETVIITAQASGQVAAINQQLNSNKIVNVVSAEKMEELPDANAAESIGRLPGISLQRSSGEANKIVVRGLSPKYNNVTIGGVKMASTNSQDRSADLSLITGEMLAGVEVSKSLRADMDADAIGGSIDLKIRKAPEVRSFSANMEGGYNQLGTSFNNYKLVAAGSNRYFKNKVGVRVQASTELKQLPSQRFGGKYSSPILFQLLDDEGNLSGETEFKLRTEGTVLTDNHTERFRDGGNLTLDYSSNAWDMKLFTLYNLKRDEVISRANTYTFIRPNEPFSKSLSIYTSNTELLTNSLENEFRFWRTKLRLNLGYTRADHRTPFQQFGFIELSNGANPINQNWLLLRQPSDVLEEFGATHVENSFLQSMSKSLALLKDRNASARLDWDIPIKISDKISGIISVGGKYQQLVRESDNIQDFVSFQYGAGRPRKEALIAMYPWIVSNLSAQRGIEANNFEDKDYRLDNFLDGRYQLGWGADADLLMEIQNRYIQENFGFYQKDGYSNYFQDYLSTEEVGAGYVMAELNIGSKLTFFPGVRYENEHTSYQGYHIEQVGANSNGIRGLPDSVTIGRNNAFFFPSLNLKYRISEALTFQGAVYKSTTRPDFRLLSPSIIITENTSNPFTSGNPFLQPAIAWNYDAGLLFHTNKSGLLSVNFFYKEVERFIFTLDNYFPHRRDRIIGAPNGLLDALPADNFYPMERLADVHRTSIPFNNFEPAYYKGIEFSWQTNFWYLSGIWKGLVLDVNVTMLQSGTRYPYFEDVVVGIDSSRFFPKEIRGFEYNTRKGRLVDQPRAILNLILGWDYKGFNSRFSFRYQGATLQNQDSRLALSDSYYDKFVWLDLSFKQYLGKGFSLFSNLTNIGKHIDDYFNRFGGTTNLPTSSEHYGSRIQFGLTYKY